jgi:hypothetical protein
VSRPACVADWALEGSSPCGKPAAVLVTIAGTGSRTIDAERAPQCEACANMSQKLITKHFPTTGRFTAEAIAE